MKTRDPAWFDLFHRRGTRRDFLRLAGSVAGLVALGAERGAGGQRPRLLADPFEAGIASGDPTPDGVVLWTRLSHEVLEATGEHLRETLDVRWEVAEDRGFRRVVRSGTAGALRDLGHAVHVEVEGLEPARDYHYRFMLGDAITPVGRTRTAPAVGAPLARLRFAFASCQHYEHGYYTAYRHMAAEDLDFVLHLGDYIYEGPAGGGGVRAHEGPEVRTLEAYRARYATYRSDADLRNAHRVAPWIVTWDDHEVDNNYAGDIAEDDQSPEALLLRRAAAYQAYYEHMPLRRSSMPSGPDMRLYRRMRFGDLLELNVLDTRQYRDDQPCGDGRRRPCADHTRLDRTLLGSTQRAWLLDGLTSSTARWNVLAQQVLMARLRGPGERGGASDEETYAMDMWDGYPVERARLLDAVADARVRNPVVLTGDIHSSWVCDLPRRFDGRDRRPVATELAGTSITSGGDGMPITEAGVRILEANPHVRFYNGQRGYVTVTLSARRWQSEFRVVEAVTRPGSPIRTIARYGIEDGRAGAEPT